MEYFLLRNFGYDGIMVTKYSTLPEAEAAYKSAFREQRDWDNEYPDNPSDKGLVVVGGEVVVSDYPELIFG